MNSYRQGDVYLESVKSIPKNAIPRKTTGKIVLADGEATGHQHVLDSSNATAYDDAGVTYLEVQEALAMLTHQEHAPIALPRGKYRMTRQREYAPEAPRQVTD